MTQITFLGVGGAMAQAPADNHTAFLVRTNTSTILLDSGPSIMRQLELAGVGVEELSHIYISHQHGDHSLGLPMVLLNRVLFWPELPLTVMAAPEVLDDTPQMPNVGNIDIDEDDEEIDDDDLGDDFDDNEDDAAP